MKKITLVANTKKTSVRIAEVFGISPQISRLTKENEKDFFAKNYPLGEKMNESTHVFSSTIFTNKNGQMRLFMAALPVDVCDEIARAGAENHGSIHRIAAIDCVEHTLFREYSEIFAPHERAFIFFPQDNGLRVLYIKENLPTGAVFISNHPDYRVAEFMRFYNALEESRESNEREMGEQDTNESKTQETQRAILLNFNENFRWLQELLTAQNILHKEAQHTEQENK